MLFTAALVPLSLLGLALAQNNGTNSTNVVTIQVGATQDTPNGGIFQFIPNNVTAHNGTVINFQFTGMPGNHSITQSNFSSPCIAMDGGFDSGWVSLPTAGLSPIPEWNLTITDDTKPIWFFCKQLIPGPHCAAGMVGAINAPTSGANTFANYKQAAGKVTLVPQIENGIVGIGASASIRPSPVPSGASDLPDPSITGPVSAPAPTSTSGATALSMNSGIIALVAGMTGMLLA